MKIYIIFILSIICINLYSQSANDTLKLKKTAIRLHFLPFGFSVEQRLSKNATLIMDLGTNYNLTIMSQQSIDEAEIMLLPYIEFEPRIYTNFQSRLEKGKKINYFSGAYGAFKAKGITDLIFEGWLIQTGPLIGYQSVFSNFFYWNIGIGVGATFIEEDIRFGIIGEFKLGLNLN